MINLKNREEVVSKLAELLMQFDIELNRYQTDVYLYIDDEGNGTLDTFVNIGGNSWLDDDHITIYRDREHYEEKTDIFVSAKDLAEYCELDLEKLKKEAAEAEGIDGIDDLEDFEIIRAAYKNHQDTIDKAYENYIRNDSDVNYNQVADDVVYDIEIGCV